jgi:hypothetical protein
MTPFPPQTMMFMEPLCEQRGRREQADQGSEFPEDLFGTGHPRLLAEPSFAPGLAGLPLFLQLPGGVLSL